MATFQALSQASNNYELAVSLDAMRADLSKLRNRIGMKDANGVVVYKAAVMNCAICGQPFQQGEYITHKWHTRNRQGDPNFPGWQHKHITCPRDGNPFILPGQTMPTQTETPQYTPSDDNASVSAAITQAADSATSVLDGASAQATELSDELLASVIKAVVDAINPILGNASSQTQAAIAILTDALSKQNGTIADLRAELQTLRESVQNAVPVNISVSASDPDASYVAALPTLRHHNFALLVRTAAKLHAKLPKQANVWLVGPAGTGKSTAGEQLAASLRYTTGPRKGEPLDFHYQGAVSDPYVILGYTDAHGHIVRTPTREAWENGGVLMLDELDASSESATLTYNGPLANGYAYFPVEPGKPAVKIMRHADCIVLGTANTNGMGADATYVGRNRLDGAFLSRFPCKIEWGPDENVEKTLTANDGWWRVCDSIRTECAKQGADFLVTSRDMMTGACLLSDGDFTRQEVVSMIFGAMQRQDADTWRVVGKAAEDFIKAEVK